MISSTRYSCNGTCKCGASCARAFTHDGRCECAAHRGAKVIPSNRTDKGRQSLDGTFTWDGNSPEDWYAYRDELQRLFYVASVEYGNRSTKVARDVLTRALADHFRAVEECNAMQAWVHEYTTQKEEG